MSALNDRVSAAHALAFFMEEVSAKREASAARRRKDWRLFYDAHAATELAALILRTMPST